MVLIAAGLLAQLVVIAKPDPEETPSVGSNASIMKAIEEGRAEKEKKLQKAFDGLVKEIQNSEHISVDRRERVLKDLKEAQKAWEDFRDKQMSFLHSYYYEYIGSMGARNAGIWTTEEQMIDKRIEELESPPGNF
jgi:uncharacterized protein YecT (DUF1311 family)